MGRRSILFVFVLVRFLVGILVNIFKNSPILRFGNIGLMCESGSFLLNQVRKKIMGGILIGSKRK